VVQDIEFFVVVRWSCAPFVSLAEMSLNGNKEGAGTFKRPPAQRAHGAVVVVLIR